MTFEDVIRRLAHRKIRLVDLTNLEAPQILIDREKKMIAQDELRLQIAQKEIEFDAYQSELNHLDETREQNYCPGCRYMYQTPEGKRLTELESEERGVTCTLHPELTYKGCDDFEDYGISKWDMIHKRHYQRINNAKKMAQGTRQEIGGLKAEWDKLEKEILGG